MKTIIIVILLLISIKLTTPGIKKEIIIIAGKAISEIDELWRAVCYVETRFNPLTWVIDINGLPSVGISCIQQSRIDHYNQLTGKSYTFNDCLDENISKEIFVYFARGKTIEQAARSWNGSGVMTDDYWRKIRSAL